MDFAVGASALLLIMPHAPFDPDHARKQHWLHVVLGFRVFCMSWRCFEAPEIKEYSSPVLDISIQQDMLLPSQAVSDVQGVYKEELLQHFGIVFNNLFCLNNMPIKRYVDYLQRRNKLEEYMQVSCLDVGNVCCENDQFAVNLAP